MIHWAIKTTIPPIVEPVTLTEAKSFCRISVSDDDLFVNQAIRAAREYAENVTGLAFIQTQYIQTLDRFPFPSNYDRALYSQDQFIPIGPTNMPFYEQFAIRMQRNPISSVNELRYIDQDGNSQVLDPSQYLLDSTSQQARLLPAYGLNWPIAQYQANAISVKFTAGAADATGVPASIKHAILLHVSMQYESRDPGAVDVSKAMLSVDSLLEQHRVWGSQN